MIKNIIKRDGRKVPYELSKISDAILLAGTSVGLKSSESIKIADNTAKVVDEKLNKLFNSRKCPSVEQIQDIVEESLISEGYASVAKEYILYRAERNRSREMKAELMKTFEDLTFKDSKDSDLKRENGNIDSDTAMGTMLKYGSEAAKEFNHLYLLDRDVSDAHKSGDIHIHDLDFYALTETCATKNTKIVLRIGNRVFNTTFGFFDSMFDTKSKERISLSNIEILSMNGNFVPIVSCERRPLNENEKVYGLKTGIDVIELTGNHHVPVIRDGNEILLQVKDICIGDKLIRGSRYTGKLYEINLIDLFVPDSDFVIVNTDYLRKIAHQYGFLGKMYKNLDSQKSYKYSKYFTLAEYKRIRHLFYGVIDEHDLILNIKRGKGLGYPAILPLNQSLGKIMGYVYSEGYVGFEKENKRVIFTNQDSEILLDYSTNLKNLFPNISFRSKPKSDGDKAIDIIVDSGYFAYLFNGPLGIKKNSKDISIPSWLFDANDTFLYGFFAALTDGDGSISDDLDIITYNTACKKYRDDLHHLLMIKGIECFKEVDKIKGTQYIIKNKKGIRNANSYKIRICGQNVDNFLLNLPSLKAAKKDLNQHKLRVHGKTNGQNKIKEILDIKYNGFVYDIETGDHYFNANGYLIHNCLQIPLDKLFKGGFSTGHGYLREPESIRSYAALTAIALQCNQNEMHGGQSIPALDYYLAPGVCKSYISEICRVLDDKYDISDEMKSELKKELRSHCEELNYHFMSDKGSEVIKSVLNSKGFDDEQIEKAKTKALKYTEKETYQAMEALVHNLNSMHSRAGAQVPFTSVNFGTDTSEEGRMVSRNLLLSTESGLGAGETAIFPISIFKVKEGVNYNPEDPNYDLFKLSIRVSAKRLFPTYEFLDAPYNLQYYKKGDFRTELATMGCVEEHSEIKIRYQGVVEYIRFKYLFEKIKELGLKLQTRGRAEYFDTSTIGLEVYDTYSGGFVKVLTLLRNKNVYGWRELDFNNGSALVATLDHPLPIEGKGRTYVSDIAVGDKICEAESKRVLEIIKIVDRGDSFDGGYSYDVETESDRFDVNGIQSHNCRTRVIGNVYDPTREIVTGRGNLSFTSINLPRLGIEAHGDIDKFFELLDEKMYLVKRQLTKRFKLQCSKHVYNYPFLMGQGLWLDSDKLGPNDTLEDILPHGSLSLGFLGLAECLVALIGEHHGQSDKAQELGLKIIGHMRELTDMWQKEDYINSKGKAIHLNWSILGTPAEGLSGTFLKKDRKKYGIIPGVTDKEYYTNSSHIPVGFKISFVDKIKKEAPYHALENAGHICYVEFDGDATKNLEAFEAIIRCMKENGVGYGAVNIPVDRDPVCGYTGIIGDICPKCGRDVREPISQREINEIRRKFGLTTPFNLSHSCSGDC